MAILRVEESIEVYKELDTLIEFSRKDVSGKLSVLICKKKIATGGMINTVRSKPVIYFVLPNDIEVSRRNWTPEMKLKAKEYAHEFPVPDPGKKFTLFGKMFYSAFALGILVAIGAVLYFAVFVSPGIKEMKTGFSALPSIGNKYYGSFNNNNVGESGHTWISITTVNPTDSICSYQKSTKMRVFTFNTLEEEHASFSPEIFQGKFSSREGGIKIKSLDNNVFFNATVMNNEYEKYMISVE